MQGVIQTWGTTGEYTDMGKYRGVYRHGEIQGGYRHWENRGIQASENTEGIGRKLYRIQTSGNT